MNKELLKENISESVKDILKKYNISDINESNILISINNCIDNIFEGIDIDQRKRLVSFNPNHQNYVDTNDPWNPKPIYNEVEGYKVISIFKRKETEDKHDGNPVIYALKDIRGWKFKNPSYDIFALLRRFVSVTKELKENFDVIITTPSSNKLNTEVLYRIRRLINHETSYEDFFYKYGANDVYENFLDTNYLETHYNEDEQEHIHDLLYEAISNMMKHKENKGNDGIFSYKFILQQELRKCIIKSLGINKLYKDEITYGKYLNGKKILVIDDTVTSGKTISDSATAIKDMYDPESITFLTLFSPLERNKNNLEK